ncbi:hypothetical protein GCM10027093_69770 [Paraburkholderia jirisanensis]
MANIPPGHWIGFYDGNRLAHVMDSTGGGTSFKQQAFWNHQAVAVQAVVDILFNEQRRRTGRSGFKPSIERTGM